jgi:uncharacterized membrane protein
MVGEQYEGTGRLEAFSDGVMAIAITLLVLDLIVPTRQELGGQSLAHALGRLWPNYAAFVVSFFVIGIIWVNHHGMFSRVRKVDRLVLFANLLLLLVVSAIPFPTRLLAEYLTAGGSNAHIAAAVYSSTMLAMSVAFILLWLAVTRSQDLLEDHVDVVAARASLLRFGAGLGAYAATIGLAFVSAPLTLVVHFMLAVYYCFDQLSAASGETLPPATTG